MQFESIIGQEKVEVTLDEDNSVAFVNGKEVQYELILQQNGRVLFRNGTKLYKVDNIAIDGQSVSFSIDGVFVETTVKDDQELMLEKLGFTTNVKASAGQLNAPMPGKILELLVSKGDEVTVGQPVIILEAMKMENELKAPVAGVIVSLDVAQNDNVEKNQSLLEIEPRG
jgi:biotin carboxyl carrier protein